MATANKVEFVNQTQGWVGVTKINRKGDEVGEPVEPGARVFLTKEEIEATEQAHKRAEDSPFADREIVIRNPADESVVENFVGPQLKRITRRRTREPAAA